MTNLEYKTIEITTPEDLAKRMARLTHLIRAAIIQTFKKNDASKIMRDQLAAFDNILLPGITEVQFADMFAQTLAYGLFAARSTHTASRPFTRHDATHALPTTNPLLRTFFATISSSDLDDEPFVSFVDELAQVLNATRMDEVLANFGKYTRQEDPLSHFYEIFLNQYDPRLRELRGVYYTPGPVISYIVRSVDYLLKEEFGIEEGLADGETIDLLSTDAHGQQHTKCVPRVLILDPACGTGTFLSSIVEYIRESSRPSRSGDRWLTYVRASLLPRLFGFEVLMAPYAMAHLRLGMQLAGLDLPSEQRASWQYQLDSDEHLGIYLTNALSDGLKQTAALLMSPHLSHEAPAAKRQSPVMVVIGNPPYAGHSANKAPKKKKRENDGWLDELMKTYKEGYAGLEKPGQTKWLQNDYVKFIRFAQWSIEQTGHGIVAFITDHSYLDNPTFRGMRHSLMKSFDEIYILDLHGNVKKREKAFDGSKDENIFDIQQGVAVGIFIKRQNQAPGRIRVKHAELWGVRENSLESQPSSHPGKYSWLNAHSLSNTVWTELHPQAPFYLFKPQTDDHLREYERGWKIPEIFRPNGDPAPGIVTTQDEFAISWTRDEAVKKVEALLMTETEEEARALFRLCTQDQWHYALAKKELAKNQWREKLTEVLYRPFDRRWTVFDRYVAVHRRERVMRHMLTRKNLGMTIGKAGQVIDQGKWDLVFCTRDVTEFNLYRRGGNNLFPLYLYPEISLKTHFEGNRTEDEATERICNLNQLFLDDFAARLSLQFIPDGTGDLQATFGPEDIFRYMYALFHAPTYRKRYAEFLKIDFPRLPLTSNLDLFRALCTHGQRLVELHLLENISQSTASLQGQGNYTVEKVKYLSEADPPETGRVWINKTQYFPDVAAEVWTFHIGGYQICQKWLKDRKGRTLTPSDLRDYSRIVSALGETIALMQRIDTAIEEHGGWPIQ